MTAPAAGLRRRRFLQWTPGAVLAAPAIVRARPSPDVVIIGGGFGGITAAKYLRRNDPGMHITLIEPNAQFMMCPLSIRVIRASLNLREIATPYAPFVRMHGLDWVQDRAVDIDPIRQTVTVGKRQISYDRLIVSPGVEFVYDSLPGLGVAAQQALVPHAWRAGPQTVALRDQVRAMREGGVVGLHIPKSAIRARPAAYERAALLADYFAFHNPKAKVRVFDANAEPPYGKGALLNAWRTLHGDRLEYVAGAEIEHVDAPLRGLQLKGQGRHKFDVLNVIPPQRAGAIARMAGLNNAGGGAWCGVNFQSMESTAQNNIHVLGDAVAGVAGMPKAGQMANQQAKVCAAYIAATAQGQEPNPQPVMISASYMYVTPALAFASMAVYRYNPEQRAMAAMPGATSSTSEPTAVDGLYAMSWATNIHNDMFA